MQRMIENGEIGTVIVKDLSRFGRNYLDVGEYLKIKYPTLGVRFIKVFEQDKVDLRIFLETIRECTDIKELTPEIVNRLIKRIEVKESA